LHGILEEIASLVVILRLWRFFKIVEEFSVGAQQQMDGLRVRIEQLEGENEELKVEVKRLKRGRDEETDVGF
jgi:voltage-gated hydrogen channel 1